MKNALLALLLAGVSLAAVRSAAAQPAGPTCSIFDATVDEGDSGTVSMAFTVECDNPTTVTESIGYLTSDVTATEPDDYLAAPGGLDVPPGHVDHQVLVEVVGDSDSEPDETFRVSLSDPESVVVFGRQEAIGTIRDDDGTTPGLCILLSETAVSVSGPASTPTRRNFAGQPRLTMQNCGSAAAAIEVRGTNATGPGATWQLTNASSVGPVDSTCELGVDVFRADVTIWLPDGGPFAGVGTPLTTSATPLLGVDGTTPFTFDPAAEQEISPSVELPCVGSDGLGQPMSMEVVITAVPAS